jgi:hypothetical protein
MTLAQQLEQIKQKNVELAAKLELREQLNLSLIKQLSVEKEDLERHHAKQLAEISALKAEKDKLLNRDQRAD